MVKKPSKRRKPSCAKGLQVQLRLTSLAEVGKLVEAVVEVVEVLQLEEDLGLLAPDQQAAFESRRRTVQLEESAFSKLSPPVLERLNILASYADLRRPIPEDLTRFDYSRFGRARAENHQRLVDQEQSKKDERDTHPLAGWLDSASKTEQKQNHDVGSDEESDDDEEETEDQGVTGIEETGELRLPKRPKWRSDMDTKTIHAQEQEVFRQWLRKTDGVVERGFFTSSPMFAGLTSHTRSEDKAAFPASSSTNAGMGGSRMVSTIASQDSIDQLLAHRPSPGTSVIGSLYERNIEVYRQLWRVCERSDLVCVLADARCPLLHLPPSLIGFWNATCDSKSSSCSPKPTLCPKISSRAGKSTSSSSTRDGRSLLPRATRSWRGWKDRGHARGSRRTCRQLREKSFLQR